MRKIIPRGYKLQTGAILSNAQVDSYNSIQRTINRFIEAGMSVPEYLTYGSRNLMVSWHNNSLEA